THDHHGNLHLTLRQPLKDVFVCLSLKWTQSQFLCDVWADITLPGIHHPDRLHHLLDISTLGNVISRPGLHDSVGEQIILNGRDRNHANAIVKPLNFADGFQPSDARHAQIHQHNVDITCACKLNGFLAAGGFADNLNTWLIPQHTSDASPNQIMIVDNQNFDQNPPLEWLIHEPSLVRP